MLDLYGYGMTNTIRNLEEEQKQEAVGTIVSTVSWFSEQLSIDRTSMIQVRFWGKKKGGTTQVLVVFISLAKKR